MRNLIYTLEERGQRELYSSFTLPQSERQALWKTLEKMEKQALILQKRVCLVLPPELELIRRKVELTNYHEPPRGAQFKIRAQLSQTNHGSFLLRLHCHALQAKGQFLKIARADYHYQTRRQND